MTVLLGTNVSISLDSMGCFRAELARACGAIPASLRRWHSVQVRSGRLREGRDFVVVRQSPYEQNHDDDVFYFYEAIKICQRQTAKKQIDLSLIQLNTLRAHGLQVVDGQVVRRNQLRLFEMEQRSDATSTGEGIHSDLFSVLLLRQYKSINILQRYTDGYIKVDKLCQAIGENWSKFEDELSDSSTELGLYAQMLNSTPRSYRMPLVQKLGCDDPVIQGNWADPRIVRRVAERIDIVLANLVEQWEIDLERRLCSLRTNSERISKDHRELLEEVLKRMDRQHDRDNHLLRGFESLKEDIKNRDTFDLWNQKIQQCTAGAISTHLQYWNVFKQKPTKATRTRFPFIYVIVVYAQHIQHPPRIFYVGQTTKQPFQRFSNHDGLKSVEALMKHGYKYEIRYFESERFQTPTVIKNTEKALQVALSPYWEYLTADQHDKIKRGESLNDEVIIRLLTIDELIMVS